jgi:hypothetical protein
LRRCNVFITPPFCEESDDIIDMLFTLYDRWNKNFSFSIIHTHDVTYREVAYFNLHYHYGSFCLDDVQSYTDDESFNDIETDGWVYFKTVFTEEDIERMITKLCPKRVDLVETEQSIKPILKYCKPEIINYYSSPVEKYCKDTPNLYLVLKYHARRMKDNIRYVKTTDFIEDEEIILSKAESPKDGTVKCIGLSIKEILCKDKKEVGDVDQIISLYKFKYIYPDIITMELPLTSMKDILYHNNIFPNVTNFYAKVSPIEFEHMSIIMKGKVPKINLHLVC